MTDMIPKEEEEEQSRAADASTGDAAEPDPDKEPAPPCADMGKFLRRSAAGDVHLSLESFPYHLCETTKELLRSAAHLHLVCKKRFAPGVPSLSQFLCLYGPPGSEICQETLAVALAEQFGAALLTFDPLPQQPVDSSLAAGATADTDTQADTTDTQGILPIISGLVKVASEESKHGPLVLFLSDIFVNDLKKSIAAGSITMFSMLKEHLDKIPAGVLVIGSRVHEEEKPHSSWSESKQEYKKESIKKHPKKLSDLFPNQVTIRVPQDEDQVAVWKHKLDRDTETLRARRNNARIRSTLELIGWSCIDLEAVCVDDRMLSEESASRVVGYAVMHHLEEKSKKPADGADQDVLSSDSIRHGFSLLEAIKSPKKSLKDVVATANMFERKLLDDAVVPAEELGVGFEDVGGLEDVKDALRESVMLPLQRPELFSKGQLRRPCKGGILLFGPPGTGKTLLARAVAAEAGTNFISLSMSSSKWHGDAERYAKAAFTLASKISPSVVFVDEVDAISGSRGPGEHKSSRALKNELMMSWDGLCRKEEERVSVIAATNRPFDLGEDVLRRFPRRLAVGLPDSSNREKILRVVLSKEELAPDVDLVGIANMTDGYSGSDLRELCVVAAHCAIKEVLEKERSSTSSGSGVDEVRAFEMDDFRYARERVGAGTSSGSADTRKLGDWSDRYGEGGSRKNQVPSYFM